MDVGNVKLAVVGLGYVGLPLAVEFAKVFNVIGYDIDHSRIAELETNIDRTAEVSPEELLEARSLEFTTAPGAIAESNTYVVTTPTPIDKHKQPDLQPVVSATKMLAGLLKPTDVVIYESTVYPGATEEVCVPLLEEGSGLKCNSDFYVGYSPERINPGDKRHRLAEIMKITSGSTRAASKFVDELYSVIITAGTFTASSIRVAEAAKVIENTQRDVNIALINELALLFNGMNIDTEEVLMAAETKWNFLSFRPGLVGGHCIGVDPYYLTYKAQELGYHPEIILAGRRLNDSMGSYVASQLIKAMVKNGQTIAGAKILLLGLAFKENTPDLRNSRSFDLIEELEDYGAQVEVHDPCVDPAIAAAHGTDLLEVIPTNAFDAIVIAVAHDEYRRLSSSEIRSFGRQEGSIIFDLKYVLSAEESDLRL